MIVEAMPLAGVRMSGRRGVMSIERVADVVNDRVQVVQRSTSQHKRNETVRYTLRLHKPARCHQLL